MKVSIYFKITSDGWKLQKKLSDKHAFIVSLDSVDYKDELCIAFENKSCNVEFYYNKIGFFTYTKIIRWSDNSLADMVLETINSMKNE